MRKPISLLVLPLVLILVGACGQETAVSQSENSERADRTQSARAAVDPEHVVPSSLAPMLARVSPAVVNISVEGTREAARNPLFDDPFFRRFFGLPNDPRRRGERFQTVGSGVIYDASKGHVITNHHVVDHADNILVTLKDRRQLQAELVAADPQTDIAVLKIAPEDLTGIPLGTSADLKVGDYVVAIGDPFGVGQTATFGIVSAVGRTGLGIEGREGYEDFIQTDASINPGNSGGALVDVGGRLVGMNTAILSRSGGNIGIGFAIPIDMIKVVAEQLIASGKVARGELGVTIQDMTPALAQAMGVGVSDGVVVAQVQPGSAAARSGILTGDVIVSLNGEKVIETLRFRNRIAGKRPGTRIELEILRDGERRTVTATLQPQTPPASAETPSTRPERAAAPLLGLSLRPVPPNRRIDGRGGAYVAGIRAGSPADQAGLQRGDIVVAADNRNVDQPADLTRIIRQHKDDTPLLLRVRRGSAVFYAAIG